MRVKVLAELQPGEMGRGTAEAIRQKVFDLPICPGPGWWLEVAADGPEYMIHSAGVAVDGAWCCFRVTDMRPFTDEEGWS